MIVEKIILFSELILILLKDKRWWKKFVWYL